MQVAAFFSSLARPSGCPSASTTSHRAPSAGPSFLEPGHQSSRLPSFWGAVRKTSLNPAYQSSLTMRRPDRKESRPGTMPIQARMPDSQKGLKPSRDTVRE